MNGRRIAVLVVGLLVLAGSAVGQEEERPRYRLPDAAVTTADLNAFLKRHQSQIENNDQARKLLESLLKNRASSAELRDLQRLLQRNGDLRKLAEKQLGQPDLRKAIADLQKQQTLTRDQIGDLIGKLEIPVDRLPPELRKFVPDNPPSEFPPSDFPMPPPHPAKDGPALVNPPRAIKPPLVPQPPPRQPESTNDWVRNQASQWVGSFAKDFGSLDNETLKGIVEALRHSGVMPSKFDMPEWLKSSTSSLPGTLKGWLPDMGSVPQMGNFNLGGWNVSAPETPSLPSAENAGKSLSFLFLLVLFGVAAWILWQTRGLGALGTASASEGRKLGPWPVAPDRVATRGEVVLAFEYLARKILGLPAETSHHREVGRLLARHSATKQQRDAAADLAALYETARYTPPTQTLSPEELARAQQALRLLATVNIV